MFIASGCSQIGSWMQNVILPVYVYDRTGSVSMVSVMMFAQLGPTFVLSIPSGIIADRVDRRRWLMVTQLIQLVFSAALAPLVAIDAPVSVIFVVALGVGCGAALNNPTWVAMLPTLVAREDLSAAIALNAMQTNLSRVVGPIIVAVLRTAGATNEQMFIINAATYGLVIAALLRTKVARTPPGARSVGWRQLTDGIAIVRRNKPVDRLVLGVCTFTLVSLPWIALYPVVVRRNFGVRKNSTTYEWLFAGWSFGGFLGCVALGTVLVFADKRVAMRWGFLAYAVCLGLYAVVREPLWAFVIGPPLGFAYLILAISMSTIIQSRIADNERGRVMALWGMAVAGAVPIGGFLFAPAIDAIGARWVLIGGAVWALFLAWWCDVKRFDSRVEQLSARSFEPDSATVASQPRVATTE